MTPIELLAAIAEAAAPLLPAPIAAPVKVVGLLLQDAAGRYHNAAVADIVARETAAGEAANKAAHLAGLREAINEDLALNWDDYIPARERAHIVNALMGHIIRRLP
jgi:hypothetical protein